jgi:antitoxin component YwqK of YwqJK toxin-antitoxin module
MKQKTCCLLVLFNIAISCFSQDYKYVYYLDNNLVSTNESAALFVGKGKIENGNFKLDCFNKLNNSLIMTIYFTDSTLSDMNGSFTSFYKNGVKENVGNYLNNLEEGFWIKRDTSGLLRDSSIYKSGVKYAYAKFEYNTHKQVSSYEFTDSLKNTYQYISFDSTGTKKAEANFIGNNGIYNFYDSGKVKSENVFSRELKEAECPAFKKHLLETLRPDESITKGAKPGIYQIIIRFIVNTDGSVSDIVAETNYGYGMEAEGIRVIKNSPKWTPASMFGKLVKAYRRQPITFSYTGDY